MLFPKVCGVDLGTDTIKIKEQERKKVPVRQKCCGAAQ